MPSQQRQSGNNKDKRQRLSKNSANTSGGGTTRPPALPHHANPQIYHPAPAPSHYDSHLVNPPVAPSGSQPIVAGTSSSSTSGQTGSKTGVGGSATGNFNPVYTAPGGYNWERSLTPPPASTPPPPTPPSKRALSPSLNTPLGRIMRLPQLVRDGRKPPQYYKNLITRISTPSQLSIEGFTEKYRFGVGNQFQTLEDVYRYRGYRKLGKIDEGAFGVVSKAQRIGDSLIVALKEIDLSKKRAKRIEEMKRELFVLQKVEHKNVVQLIEHFVVNDTLVIVMEFCAGSNLSNLLKETPLSEDEALHLFTQMASSIKTLHRAGIAHRDIKLNNFLLDASRKHIKVADFGLSIVSWQPPAGLFMAKTYCGTEPYMAPEILRRNKHNMRSYNPIYADVWSLGICLFAMMTRTFPFKLDLTQRSLFRAQTTRRWRFPRNVRENCSEDLNDLVWHMLDPEPERRITMNGVMSHPWLNRMMAYNFSTDDGTIATPAMITPSSTPKPLLLTTTLQPSPATRL